MYEDNGNFKVRINWKDIIIKIVLVVLFILLLIWLFPKTDLDVFYDSVYINNVNTMKEAAKSYYTKDRLPKNVGESTSMTLRQMIDNKMLIRFTDKNKNYCDETSSKVEVTKTADDKYVLRVQLHCGDQKDYILETIGCNDICTGSNCVATVIPGDTTNNDDNTNNDNDNKFDTEIPSDTSDPKYDNILSVTYYQHRRAIYTTKTEFFCFDDGYTLDGNKCTKLTDIVIDATKKDNISYTCPDGYTQNGAYCFKYAQPIENQQSICPSGYTPNGTSCYAYVEASKSTNTVCPSGYNPNGSSCYTYVEASKSTNTICPDGYDPNGSKCVKTVTGTPKIVYGNWVSKETKYSTKGNEAYTKDNEKLVYVVAISGATCGDPCNNTGMWYKYIYYTRTANKTYECPSSEYTGGGSSSKCTHIIDGTINTNYSCPTGIPEGDKCRITTEPITSTTNICPNGILEGTQCRITTEPIISTTNICPTGYNFNGSTCELKIDATKKDDISYTCPDNSYTLSGSKCIKKSKDVINANTSTTTSVSYEYKWSTSSYIEGWEFTGKTKIETKYTAGQK